MSKSHPVPICRSDQLAELGKWCFSVQYRGASEQALVVRFKGSVFGYLNHCAHMPRTLDCERDGVFDPSGRYLQCSMHGICYDPVSGRSLSEICLDQSLTAIKVTEQQGWIYLVDKHARLEPSGA